MLICLDLHALGFMPCFPMSCAFCYSRLMLGLHVHMFVWCCWLCLAWIYVFMRFFPYFMLRFTSIHAYILGLVLFHAFMLAFTCLDVDSHAYMNTSIPICLDLCFHMLVYLDLCSLHALCYLPRACALHAMFACLDLGYVCHAMCYCSPFVASSFFLVFWPIGLDPI